jgi:hypothetical protein
MISVLMSNNRTAKVVAHCLLSKTEYRCTCASHEELTEE